MARYITCFDMKMPWGRLFLICMLVALMTGCSARNDFGGSDWLAPRPQTLTESQRNIIEQNKGQIASSIPASAQPMVEQQIAYYLGPGRKVIEVGSKRAEKYLSYAKEVFRSRHMPEELAYLAIVESGYRASACSTVGAKGAWQFMPATGEMYGLEQDKWADERMNVYAATIAAANYLEKLHNDFGDWPTAIAAYNAGEGKIKRACKASGERTFFGIVEKNERLDEKTRLKKETKDYVPRFLAVVSIMNNLPQLGFKDISPETQPQVTPICLAPGTDLKTMAGVCQLSWAEFKEYNPHYNMSVSHKNRSTVAYVPKSAEHNAAEYARHPVKVDNAKAARLERENKAPAYKTKNQRQTAAKTKNGKASDYRVQPRDNLYQISRKHNVSVADLKRWNNLKNENIHVGQLLIVQR